MDYFVLAISPHVAYGVGALIFPSYILRVVLIMDIGLI